MSFFPAYFSLKNKKILLVGGGFIALEKLEKLIDFTQDITIITRETTNEFKNFAKSNSIPILTKSYKKGDIEGYDIVIVATDTVELHKEIYTESRNSRILVNSVDNTAYCDFIFPSYIKKGDLTISISTSGASPAMAKRLRQYIEKTIPSNISEFLQEMKGLRKTMPKGKERMKFFEEKTEKFLKKHFKTINNN